MQSIRKINWWRVALLLMPAIILLLPSFASAASIVTELNTNAGFRGLWQLLLNIVDSFVILLLIIVGFAEILRLKIDTYGIKKVLPTFILALVAAHFSYLFCQLLVDASNIAITFFANNTVNGSDLQTSFGAGITPIPFKWIHSVSDPTGWKQNWTMFFKIIFIFVTGILMVVLWALFIVRTYVIYLLTIASSLAMISLALPFTRTIFTRWWSELLKWVFMPVVSIFFLWLGGIVIISLQDDPLIGIVVAGICAYLAISIPWGWGLQNVVGNLGGKLAKYTGARWAADTWRKRKLDPWLDDQKGKALNWWLSHKTDKGIGVRGLMGAAIRSGLRNDVKREWRKDETKNLIDEGRREAFGGKHGKDGSEFMSVKAQQKFFKWRDHIDGMAGEWDWKQKDLKEKFYRTDAGKAAALRVAQYKYRVDFTDQAIKNADTAARNKALAFDPEYMNVNNGHYGRMVRGAMAAKAHAFTLDMEEKKLEGDIMQTVENNAYILDMAIEGIKKWKKKEEEFNKKMLDAKDETDRKYWETAARVANKMQTRAEKSYKESVNKMMKDKNLVDDKGKFIGRSLLIEQMLTDENGKYVGDDWTKAKSLADLNGFKDGTTSYDYFQGRRQKRVSIIGKEEYASVSGKRQAEASRAEIDNKKYEQDTLMKLLSGNFGGMTDAELRKTGAEFQNIINGGSSMDVFGENHAWVINQLARATTLEKSGDRIVGEEERLAATQNFSKIFAASMSRLANNSRVLTEVRAEVNKKGFTEGTDEYRTQLEKELKKKLATQTQISGSAHEKIWDDNIDIEVNKESGEISAKVREGKFMTKDNITDSKAQGDAVLMMQEVLTRAAKGDLRGVLSDARSGYFGKLKEIYDIIRGEQGKGLENYFGYELERQILEEQMKEEGETYGRLNMGDDERMGAD